MDSRHTPLSFINSIPSFSPSSVVHLHCAALHCAMTPHIFFLTAVLCFLAGLCLQESASRCYAKQLSNLLPTLYAHLMTGLHSSRAGALSVDSEMSVDTSVKNVALNGNQRLANVCGWGSYYSAALFPYCGYCPRGYTSPNYASGIESCYKCADGTYIKESTDANDNYSTACTPCSAGTYAEMFGATECTPCAAGSSSSAGASSCTPCSAGTYAGTTGSSKCTPCGAGSSSSAGASSCTPCAKGSYSSKPGSTCSLCCAGTYACSTGSVTCEKCPQGSSSPAGASSCTF